MTSNAYWKKLYVQVGDMFDHIKLDRTTVRQPFDLPMTDAEWAAAQVTALDQRPPENAGAPGAGLRAEARGRRRGRRRGRGDGRRRVGALLGEAAQLQLHLVA